MTAPTSKADNWVHLGTESNGYTVMYRYSEDGWLVLQAIRVDTEISAKIVTLSPAMQSRLGLQVRIA